MVVKGQPASQATQEVIPAKVVQAINEVKEAVENTHVAKQTLMESVIRLYQVCVAENYKLKGTQIAEMTGASAGYVSLMWRATANVPKRADPVAQAHKLGYKGFIRQYLPPPASQAAGQQEQEPSAPAAVSTQNLMDEVRRLKRAIQDGIKSFSAEARDELLFEMLDIIDVVRGAPVFRPAQREAASH